MVCRRMFPTCRVSFSGLKSEGRYAVLMDIVPVDNKRYRYAYHRSCWLVAGKADPPAPARLYVHPDSPFTGDQLRKQVVSFEKVKLTNNDMDKHGQVRSISVTCFTYRLIGRPRALVNGASGSNIDHFRAISFSASTEPTYSYFYDCETVKECSVEDLVKASRIGYVHADAARALLYKPSEE